MAALDLKRRAVRALLWWRCRPSPLIGLVRGPAEGPAAPGKGPLRVAVVQLRAGLYRSAREFASRMEPFVRAAARGGARLVVFPGENGTQLLGTVPGWAWDCEPNPEGPVDARFLRFASRYFVRAFTGIFAGLARAYRVAIVAGTIREMARDGRLVEAAYCFGPDGGLLGRQERLHLTRAEAEKGFSPGSELVAMAVLGSRLAVPVGYDASFFEIFRLALADGVDLVALPAAAGGDGERPPSLWLRIQESPLYGLASHLVGTFLGVRLAGRSGVYAPLALSPAGDGVLAVAEEPEVDALVFADLDLAALRAWRREHPPALPFAVIMEHLPRLYGLGGEPGLEKKGGQTEEEREEELAEEDHEEGPASAQTVPQEEADVEDEKAPPVGQDEEDLGQEGLGEGEDGQDEEVRSCGTSADEEGHSEGPRASDQTGHGVEEKGIESPGQQGEERRGQHDPEPPVR